LPAAKNEMTFKKVKVSDKGQISIPEDIQREIGIKKEMSCFYSKGA
jgi:bifunctional DNA-binding transcriptional regulator/antitoxin component of YhaV-PrlF toxin-antitoxin module